ncbi:MAG: hypothetical protein KF727_15275 [Microbacteriaceae bacterium]|nr:hypothetical protein [Microbacteriaceae bacterium]
MARIKAGGWFALGAGAGALVVAAAVAVWNLAPVACTTIGYEDRRPIQLELPAGLSPTAQVSACFDMNCTPVPLEADETGGYAVPQEAPYLSTGEHFAVNATGVYVEIRDGDAIVARNRFGIETVSEAPWWSRCPGPFHYGAVTVGG